MKRLANIILAIWQFGMQGACAHFWLSKFSPFIKSNEYDHVIEKGKLSGVAYLFYLPKKLTHEKSVFHAKHHDNSITCKNHRIDLGAPNMRDLRSKQKFYYTRVFTLSMYYCSYASRLLLEIFITNVVIQKTSCYKRHKKPKNMSFFYC